MANQSRVVERATQLQASANTVSSLGPIKSRTIGLGSALSHKLKKESHLPATPTIQRKLIDDKGAVISDFSVLYGNALFSGKADALRTALQEKDIQYALAPSNPMYFTFQNLKDYIEGIKVPGLSRLEKGDIKGGGERIGPEAEKDRALAVVSSLARAVANRKLQAEKEDKGFTVSSVIAAREGKGQLVYKDEETQLVAEAFANSVFYYGTTGEQDKLAIWKSIMEKAKKHKAARVGEQAGTYSAGARNLAFLKRAGGEGDQQMMDMYYGGQEFEAWHMMRNPIIGAYIHKMMGYAGAYDQAESPDTTFRKNYPLSGKEENWENRGWSQNSKPVNNPLMKGTPDGWADDMSATMEISRLIREAVFKWGGTIVMEHKNVPWDNIFGSRKRFGDTDKEIESFMEVFLAQKKANCQWGKGKLIYTYGGVPEPITKSRVRNDFWFGGPSENNLPVTVENEGNYIQSRLDWYRQLEEGNAAQRKDLKGPSDARIAEITAKTQRSKDRLDKIKAQYPGTWQDIVNAERRGVG